MSADDIEGRVRRFFDEAWNRGNLAAVDDLYAPDFAGHTERLGLPPGAEGLKHFIALNRAAFPDIQVTVHEVVVKGDKCMIRWTVRGTHLGEYQSPIAGRVAPTGRQFTWDGTSVHYLAGGKIVEGWIMGDVTSLLEQLGVL
jgi:steroid delta-isomerase-like uncharacterized protein